MLALVGVLVLGSRHLVTRGVPEVGDLLPLGADSGLLRLVLTVGLVPLGVAGAVVAARASGSTRAPVAAAVAYAALPMPYAALAAGRWAPLAVYAAAPWWLAQLTPRAAASGAVTSGAETSGAVTSRSAATSGAAVPGPVTPVPSAPLPASTGSTGGDGGGPRHLGRPDRARRGDALRRVVVLGAITAVLAAVVPTAPVLLAGTGLALGLGSLLAFRGRQVLAPVATALGGALLAVALHLPWAVDPASAAAPWSAFRRLAEADAPVHAVEPVDLLAFGVGHPGVLPWLWALPLAAAIPLLVGRGDRLAGAIRGWTLALVAWPVALAAARVGAAAPLPDVDVLLVLAGVGVASAVGLGVAAVEADVAPPRRRRVLRRDRRRWRPPSQARRLGWRSATTGVVVVAVALAALPLLRSSLDGYWGMPRGDFGGVLGFVDDEVAASGGRILWLGDERVVPLRQDAPARRADLGRGMGPRPAADAADAAVPAGDDGTAALAVTDRLPRLPDRWRPVPAAVLTSARESVEAGTAEATHRLGEALAPLGVEYVVVPQGLAPAPFGPPEAPAPAVVGALDGQFDLERVEVDPSVVVYRNLAFRTGPALGAVPDPPGQPPQTPQTFPDAASRRTPAPGQQLLDGPPPEPSPWKLRLGLTAWGAILLFILVLQRRRADEGPEVL